MAMDKNLNSNSILWDCGSSLYDSFELNSFKRQLDSAIAARSFSMPHISDRSHLPPPPMPGRAPTSNKPFKMLRSIKKFVRSVCRLKPSNGAPPETRSQLVEAYQMSEKLTSIPEPSEKCVESPGIDFMLRRTVSERFDSSSAAAVAAATIGAVAVPYSGRAKISK